MSMLQTLVYFVESKYLIPTPKTFLQKLLKWGKDSCFLMFQAHEGALKTISVCVVEGFVLESYKHCCTVSEDKTRSWWKYLCRDSVCGVKGHGKCREGEGHFGSPCSKQWLTLYAVFHWKPSSINAAGGLGLFFKALTSSKVTPVTAPQHHHEFKK